MAKATTSKNKAIPSPKTAGQYNKLLKLGNAAFDRDDHATAIKYYSKCLDYKDYSPNILIAMSKSLFALGMKGKAIALMEHALHQNANNAIIIQTLGNACIDMDMHELAIKFYNLYCKLEPNDPIGYNNLATAYRELNMLDEAINLLQSVIPTFPDNYYLWNTLGATVAYRDGDIPSLVFYEEAARLAPENAMVLSNLALTYLNIGEYEKAQKSLFEAVKQAPNSERFHNGLCRASLNMGDFKTAFEELAWHNHPSNPNSVFIPYKITPWEGQDLKDKTIFIGSEQGVGDEMFFTGLYPDLIKEAGHVIIGCEPRLFDLFKNSFKDATVLSFVQAKNQDGRLVRLYEGLEPEKVDYYCLYTELMRRKWTGLNKIYDMKDGVLQPGEDKILHWKNQLLELPNKINVGINWRSGLRQARRDRYYATLLDWAPVVQNDNINFINVQYGDCSAEFAELEAKTGVKIHQMPDLNLKDDFEDISALMKNLDLVIGTTSAPTSQAAATGVMPWWISYTRPWWAFGQDGKTPMTSTGKISVRNHSMAWPEYMDVFAREEFTPWVEERIKSPAKIRS